MGADDTAGHANGNALPCSTYCTGANAYSATHQMYWKAAFGSDTIWNNDVFIHELQAAATINENTTPQIVEY